jgi:inner membrane protein
LDNLAHTLIGIGVAKSGLSRRLGPGTTLALAVASNLPDVDALWAIWDPWDRFMLRRTHTHALLTLPALAALLAVALRWRHPERSWRVLFGLSALGIALHLLFDLVNSFGVVLLWPFTPRRFELASVFIIDVYIWGLTIAPLIASRFLKLDKAKELACRLSLGALGVYVVLCLAGRSRVETLARDELTMQGVHPSVLQVFPEPFGPQQFRVAARIGDAWHVSLWSTLAGSSTPRAILRTQDGAPRVAKLRATPRGRTLERFMAAPVWTLQPDGSVEVHDLRFSSLVIPRGPTFQVEFPPGSLEPRVR